MRNKTSYTPLSDLEEDKFHCDFVVFVNIDKKTGEKHQHDGLLSFEHLVYYVVPVDIANQVFREAVQRDYAKPLIKTGGKRKLTNMAVNVPPEALAAYKDAWHLLNSAA